MKIRLQFLLPVLALLLPASGAQAHDALQSSTNVRLRPDQLEVELIMSRVPSRALVDNPPDVPVTADNFESTYHTLLQKNAAALFEVTIDGKEISPAAISVALFEETDLRFDFLYPRPAGGRLRVVSPFVNRMDEGYINTLSYFQDDKALGDGLLTAEHPAWEITLGPTGGPAQPPAPNPAVLAALASFAKAPTPIYTSPDGHDSYFIIPHLQYFFYLASAVLAVFAYWVSRKKKRNLPPEI